MYFHFNTHLNKLMRKIVLFTIFFIGFSTILTAQMQYSAQEAPAFKEGEWLEYRLSYSNFLNAGSASMEILPTSNNNRVGYHFKAQGKSTGLVSLFFKVRDHYESYVYKDTFQPFKFVRNINEGGYKKNKIITFDYESNKATENDLKKDTLRTFDIENDIQDLISAVYFMRNQDLSHLRPGENVDVKIFFDQETNIFKLRFLGSEVIKTTFGKTKALRFRPMVQSGRVFKEEESVTLWVTDDKNKIPLKIKASLAVGSLNADLENYKGLAHPFNLIFDN